MNATQLLAHFDRLAEAPDAVPRLRRFILELAVRGKLVEQDSKDEPALALLERINAERARLVKEGTIKAAKAQATFVGDLPANALPGNWSWVPFGATVNSHLGGGTPSKANSTYWGGDIPWASVKDVGKSKYLDDTVDRITKAGLVDSSSNLIEPGSLIVVTRMGLGKVSINRVAVAINQDLRALSLSSLVAIDYCYIFFKTHGFEGSGLTVKGIKVEELLGIPFPLPPLAEQHRIVAKVDELMALCDQLEAAQQERERRRDRLATASLQRLNQPADTTNPETQREHAHFHLRHLPRLTTRPEHIKAMRRTVLNLAVRGMLVKQHTSDQTAHDLLKQMLDQKTLLIKEGVLPKSKDAAPISAKELPAALPSSWCWTRIESVCAAIVDCPHSTPSFIASGVACLDTNSFKAGSLTPHKIRYVSEETYQERIKRLVPQGGDIVFAREGSVGESVIVPDGMRCCLGQRVMLFRPLQGILPAFFQLALSEPSSLERLLSLHKGIGAKHVNVADMRNALLPLPPLAEQHRIVAKVGELMALCDQLEAQLSTTQTDSRRLLEAVLSAALEPA